MTPEAVMVLVNGMVLGRDAVAASLDDAPFTALMSSVYCSVEGRIRLALYQQTTITH